MWGYVVDGILIVTILVCVLIGIGKGLFDSVLSLIGTGLALVISVFTAKYAANLINKIFNFEQFVLDKIDAAMADKGGKITFFKIELNNNEVAKFCVWICTVIILFFAIKLLVFILAKIFEAVVSKSSTLSGINRVLGMVFGLVKGAVTVVAMLAVCSLVAQVPGIGQPVYDAVESSLITSKVFNYVDEFCEKNLTQERVDSIIDRIVSEAKSDNGDNTTETQPEEVTISATL